MVNQHERPMANVIDYDKDVYETRDFNFAAFVLARIKEAKIATLRPFRGNDKRTYFRFVFIGIDGYNVKVGLETLYSEYMGGRLFVEPNAYNTARNNLREVVIIHHQRRMQGRSERGNRQWKD